MSVQNTEQQWYNRALKFTVPNLFEIVVVYSDTILKILTGPPEMEEDHQILGTGGPLGECSRKLISNPGNSIDVAVVHPGEPAQRKHTYTLTLWLLRTDYLIGQLSDSSPYFPSCICLILLNPLTPKALN